MLRDELSASQCLVRSWAAGFPAVGIKVVKALQLLHDRRTSPRLSALIFLSRDHASSDNGVYKNLALSWSTTRLS
jgi:hypothetical protein